jgi:ribosomal protein S18 acetylase RimI-like enzyme
MDNDSNDAIVQLDQADAEVARRIKQLHDAAYAVESSLLGLERFPPLNRTLESYAHAASTFFGYLRNDDVVGSVEVEVSEPGVFEIASLVVDPDCARQGIGKKLMLFVLKIAGTRRVTVSTAKGNYPAKKLYKGLGFRKVDQWLTEDGLDIVQWEKWSDDCDMDCG